MKVNKLLLQNALDIVKPGLSNKELIDQSTSFAFMGDKVVTYNDDISISHPIPGLYLTGAVKADKLYSLLGKIKEEEIEILVEGPEIIIKASNAKGRAKAGLTLQQDITLPLEEEVTYKEKWKKIPATLIPAMYFAMPCCSRDSSRPVLTCVHVIKEGFVEASDSLRIMRYSLGVAMPIDTFLLPVSAAMTMCKMQPTHIAKGRGWIHFKTKEETVLSCRIFEDKFPETAHILKVKGASVTLPKGLDEVVDRASIFAKRDHQLDESITIFLESKQIKVRSEAEEGWFEESVRFKYEGEDASFSIAPYLLRGMLKETSDGVLNATRLKFKGENWEYVSLLKAK